MRSDRIPPVVSDAFLEYAPTYVQGFELLSKEPANYARPDFATGTAYLLTSPTLRVGHFAMTSFGIWIPGEQSAPNQLFQFDSYIPLPEGEKRRVMLGLRRVINQETRKNEFEAFRLDRTSPEFSSDIAIQREGVPDVDRKYLLNPEQIFSFLSYAKMHIAWCASKDYPKGDPFSYKSE